MKVYLAGGINGLSDTLAKDWRAYAKSRLPDTLDPMDRDYRGVESMHIAEIVDGDIADINACDAVLAMCQKASWGTAMEIRYAWQLGKPVFAVIGFFDQPLSPWLAYHTKGIYGSLGQAIDAIEQYQP